MPRRTYQVESLAAEETRGPARGLFCCGLCDATFETQPEIEAHIDSAHPLQAETPRRADVDNELILVVSVLNGLVTNLATWVRTR